MGERYTIERILFDLYIGIKEQLVIQFWSSQDCKEFVKGLCLDKNFRENQIGCTEFYNKLILYKFNGIYMFIDNSSSKPDYFQVSDKEFVKTLNVKEEF